MQYFCTADQRKGSCYHEFYRGKWKENDFWNPRSLFLHDDRMLDTGLAQAFRAVLPAYAYYGVTEVTQSQWLSVREYAKTHLGQAAQNALAEIDGWAKDVFIKEGLLSILGI